MQSLSSIWLVVWFWDLWTFVKMLNINVNRIRKMKRIRSYFGQKVKIRNQCIIQVFEILFFSRVTFTKEYHTDSPISVSLCIHIPQKSRFWFKIVRFKVSKMSVFLLRIYHSSHILSWSYNFKLRSWELAGNSVDPEANCTLIHSILVLRFSIGKVLILPNCG